jgi:hypothetical protein
VSISIENSDDTARAARATRATGSDRDLDHITSRR